MSPFVAAGSQAWTQPYLRKRARRRCLPADTAMCDTLHSMVGRWAEPAPPPCLFPDAPLAVSLAQPVWIGVVLCWHPLPLVGKGGDRSLGGRRTRTPAQPGKPAGDARPTPAHPAKSGARALAAHSPVTAWVPGVASPSPAAHTRGPDIRPAQTGPHDRQRSSGEGEVLRVGGQTRMPCRLDGQRRFEVKTRSAGSRFVQLSQCSIGAIGTVRAAHFGG